MSNKLETSQRQQDSYQALMSLIRVTGLLQKVANRFFRTYKITQSQFNVLIVLKYDFPNGAIQNELSQSLLVDPADMTGLIKRMIKQQWITRIPHLQDDRAKVVRLTDQGKQLLLAVEPKYYQAVSKLMGSFSEKHHRELIKQMSQLETQLLSIEF